MQSKNDEYSTYLMQHQDGERISPVPHQPPPVRRTADHISVAQSASDAGGAWPTADPSMQHSSELQEMVEVCTHSVEPEFLGSA